MKHKLETLLSGIEIGLFDLALHWGEETYAPYYDYFNDEDSEIRSRSILAFTAMLGNWLSGPADVFRANKNPNITHFPIKQVYHFDDYLPAFLKHASSIRKDYPTLYTYTLYYLQELDKQEPFEQVFPEINPGLFQQMRTQLFTEDMMDKISFKNLPAFNQLLREMRLPTFFKD